MILLSSIPSFPLPLHPNSKSKPKSYSAAHVTRVCCLRRCELFDLYRQLIPYDVAWSWPKNIVREKKSQIENEGDCSDTLIILQHPSVYTWVPPVPTTTSTLTSKTHLFIFIVLNVAGQLHSTALASYVPHYQPPKTQDGSSLVPQDPSGGCIRVLSSTFSIQASRLEGLTGVWVGNQKLAALGIRVAHWITNHGLALNVTTDLTPFEWIIPCGIRDRKVGRIKGLLREAQSCIAHGTADLHNFSTTIELFLYPYCVKGKEPVLPKKQSIVEFV